MKYASSASVNLFTQSRHAQITVINTDSRYIAHAVKIRPKSQETSWNSQHSWKS